MLPGVRGSSAVFCQCQATSPELIDVKGTLPTNGKYMHTHALSPFIVQSVPDGGPPLLSAWAGLLGVRLSVLPIRLKFLLSCWAQFANSAKDGGIPP